MSMSIERYPGWKPDTATLTVWMPAEAVPVDSWHNWVGKLIDFADLNGAGRAWVTAVEIPEDRSGAKVTLLIPVEH